MLRSTTWIAIAFSALGSFVAQAADAPAYDVKVAFTQTDSNKDGAIEIDEFYDRLVDTFFLGDADKDGFLTEEEFVRVVVIKEDFTSVDKSSDGKLSRQEYVSARLPNFMLIDTDHNGSLSLVEVEAAYAGRKP